MDLWAPDTDSTDALAASARGWHGIQLAVLGFIGLCGVLQQESGLPRWLQIVAGVLVLAALASACAGIGLVGLVAWPVQHDEAGATPGAGPGPRAARRLGAGIVLTFAAVFLMALAGTSAWWPSGSGGDALVQVSTNGGVLCGELVDSDPGTITVARSGQSLVVRLGDVLQVDPVATCE